ncbi:hypothetical protein I4U23_016539 [Adineta vaga]|nr:hypothetical protein I4U23_016539 [Adineta vaga]
MFQSFMNKPNKYMGFQASDWETARALSYARRGRYGYVDRLGGRPGFQPTITVLVQWTPEFARAYQQFINGGMGAGYGRGI